MTLNDTDTVTSPYLEELTVRLDRLRKGRFALSQVSGTELATLNAVDKAIRTVEAQMYEERHKITTFSFRAVPVAQRKSECYCDSAYHPNGH